MTRASLPYPWEHLLEDIDLPMRLHQVIAPGAFATTSLPRTASSQTTNLRPVLDPFVGRTEDVSELTSLLAFGRGQGRPSGPGGVG